MKLLYLPNEYSQQRQREKKVNIYPIHLAMEATYAKNQGHEVCWGESPQAHDFDKLITEPEGLPFAGLPSPDRFFTGAFDRRYQRNGNFKYHPGTYIQSASGCWYGRCSFCVEGLRKWEVRPLDAVLEEVEECKRLGFKEIFDDSGTFPMGEWLSGFCERAPRDVVYGCNMRVVDAPWRLMKRAGFRMILFGIESANQQTLDRINKGIYADDIIRIMKDASEAGLEPHGCFMTGYPWETEEDEKRTIKLCHDLLKKGYLKTAQASVFAKPCQVADCSSLGHKYRSRFFDVYKNPAFILRKLSDIRRWEDLTYLLRGVRLIMEEKWLRR